MLPTLTDSRLANLGAQAIYEAFDTYLEQFTTITRRARTHFESRDWHAMQADAAARLDLYTEVIARIVLEIRGLLGARGKDKLVWASVKAVYSGLIASRDEWELAETFFNSVTRRIFTTVGVDPQIEFVDSDFDAPPTKPTRPMFRSYLASSSLVALIEKILADVAFTVAYEDRGRDARLAAQVIGEYLHALGRRVVVDRAELLSSIFYRGKGAYLIGRMWCGGSPVPLVLALQHHKSGIVLDAALFTEDEVSILPTTPGDTWARFARISCVSGSRAPVPGRRRGPGRGYHLRRDRQEPFTHPVVHGLHLVGEGGYLVEAEHSPRALDGMHGPEDLSDEFHIPGRALELQKG